MRHWGHFFQGELKFKDVAKETGIWRPKEPLAGFQVLFVDGNKDGWPDIYVANDSEPSFYFESNVSEGAPFSSWITRPLSFRLIERGLVRSRAFP